jgi:hypothetical protein
MQWLVHGALHDAVMQSLKQQGHQTHALAELGAHESPRELIKAAQTKQWDIITDDPQLVQLIYDEKIWFNRSIVFLQLAGGDVEQDDAIDRLFARYKRLTPGRLYSVTETRVKVRQLPRSKT